MSTTDNLVFKTGDMVLFLRGKIRKNGKDVREGNRPFNGKFRVIKVEEIPPKEPYMGIRRQLVTIDMGHGPIQWSADWFEIAP